MAWFFLGWMSRVKFKCFSFVLGWPLLIFIFFHDYCLFIPLSMKKMVPVKTARTDLF